MSRKGGNLNAVIGLALGGLLIAGASHHHGGTGTAAAGIRTAALTGSNEAVANSMAASGYGWTGGNGQAGCLDRLWTRENSGWNPGQWNLAGSGAYGIPQALPASKMAAAGPDWQTSAVTQIRWGLKYIQDRYGTPCGAWDHETADSWY